MKRASFSVSLTRAELERMMRRYHFEAAQLSRLGTLQEALLPYLRPEACYELVPERELRTAITLKSGGCLRAARSVSDESAEAPCGVSALCAVTLGRGADEMRTAYGGVRAVLDDYMLDCLGNALLEKLYDQIGGLLHRETGLFLTGLLFPGAQLPLELLGWIVDRLSGGGSLPVSYSEELVLRPRQSVVWIGTLGTNRVFSGVCGDCPRTDCENRRGG